MDKPKILFFDAETSPNLLLSFRIGQKVSLSYQNIVEERKIICICYKWLGQKKVHTVKWSKDKDDKQLLKDFVKVLKEADIVVAHNGDKYDIPFINGRLLAHNLPPCNELSSIDTLKCSRGNFYLNSHRLDYLGQYLQLGRKIDTGGFELWKAITLKNCQKSLRKMIAYCKQDVLLLEKVYKKILPYVKTRYHLGKMQGKQDLSCTNCGSERTTAHRKYMTRAGGEKQVMRCQECGTNHTVPRSKYLKLRG